MTGSRQSYFFVVNKINVKKKNTKVLLKTWTQKLILIIEALKRKTFSLILDNLGIDLKTVNWRLKPFGSHMIS